MAETRETAEELMARGLKGRELAFQLAGRQFKTSKESVEEKRLENIQNRKSKKQAREENSAGPNANGQEDETPEEDLWRLLGEDDGGEESDRVATKNLDLMLEKWGSRLRIRATDDEIYYRLVGTYQRNPRITPIIFHILQTTAKCRERGITTIDLGPAVGAGQGSLHYYMKVLTGLGLCAKIPTISFSAMTNILIFHRFLRQNPTYQAMMGFPDGTADEHRSKQKVEEDELDPELDDDAEFSDPDAVDAVSSKRISIAEWGFEFPPLTEQEVMVGTAVKERLLQILDYPKLKNHLLQIYDMLPVLGWNRPMAQRHKRAFSKHVDSLIFANIVEKVTIAGRKRPCVRLTKYNPAFVSGVQKDPSTLDGADLDEDLVDPSIAEQDLRTAYNEPFVTTGQASLATPVEYQIVKMIVDSGTGGMTISDIRDNLTGYYRRSIEHIQIRTDGAIIPPHLRHMSLQSSMETLGRERRIRCYSTAALREVIVSQGHVPSDIEHPPAPPEAGHWQDLSFRDMYTSIREFNTKTDKFLVGQARISNFPAKHGRPRTGQIEKQAPVRKSIESRKSSITAKRKGRSDSPIEKGTKKRTSKKAMKYSIVGQSRGRPRKYLHVVEPSGKINRNIIGTVFPHPDLAPIYVYLPDRNLLVVPPAWYTGIGPPPELDVEALASGKSPGYFDSYPADKPKQNKRKGREREPKLKRKKDDSGAKEVKEPKKSIQGKESNEEFQKDSKKRKKGLDGAEVATPTAASKRKKVKKDKGHGNRTLPAAAQEAGKGDCLAGPSTISFQQSTDSQQAILEEPSILDQVQNPTENVVANQVFRNIDPSTLRDGTRETIPALNEPGVTVDAPTAVDSIRTSKTGPTTELRDQKLTQPERASSPPRVTDSVAAGRPPVPVGFESATGPVFTDLAATTEASQSPKAKKRGRPPKSKGKQPEAPTQEEAQVDSPQPIQNSSRKKTKGGKSIIIIPDDNDPISPETKPSEAALSGLSRQQSAATPKPRSPSPMIGADFPESKPFFTFPTNSNPKISAFVLPAVVRSYKRKLGRLAANSGSESDIQVNHTPDPDVDPMPSGQTAQSTPTPLARFLPKSRFGPAQPSGLATGSRVQRSASEDAGPVETGRQTDGIVAGDGSREMMPKASENVISSRIEPSAPGMTGSKTTQTSADSSTVLKSANQSGDPDEILTSSIAATGVSPDIYPATDLGDVATSAAPEPSSHGAATDYNAERTQPASDTLAQVQSQPIPVQTEQKYVGPSVPYFTPKYHESTPLREMTPSNPAPESRIAARGPVRLDIQQLKRANEICEALRDAGGVLTEHKLRKQHNDWSIRVAGTNVPFAPAIGYNMDRHTFIRTLAQVKSDGRIKQTSSMVATSTGRWQPSSIIYLPETPWDTVAAYIRVQSDAISQILTPKKKTPREVADTDFSILRKPEVALTKAKRRKHGSRTTSALQPQSLNSPLQSELRSDISPTERRETLLRDPEIVSTLYGFQAARNTRCRILHAALIRAMDDTESKSVLSTSPRVFALPLLMEDLTVSEWFSVVRIGTYSEDLETFIRKAENQDVKLRDLPASLGSAAKLAAHGARNKFGTLLDGLVALKIIEPLVAADESNYSLACSDRQLGGKSYFKGVDSAISATYFRIFDAVPLYHFAADVMTLLAVLPIKDVNEAEHFWSLLKAASMNEEVSQLPQIQGIHCIDRTNMASFTEVSDVSDKQRQYLLHRPPWRVGARLHPVQEEALNNWVKAHLTSSESDEQELAQLAGEYAVPLSAVRPYVDQRREILHSRRVRQEKKVATVKVARLSAREKRERDQIRAAEELKQKLADRAAKQKAEWRDRVRTASERTKTPFSEELVDYVGRYMVQSSTIKMTGRVTDEAICDACRSYLRIKNIGTAVGPGQAKPVKAPRSQAPKVDRESAAKKKREAKEVAKKAEEKVRRAVLLSNLPIVPVAANVPEGAEGPRRRRRKVWTAEDEEDLLDCEAILRARSKEIVNSKGRAATERIIHGVGHQTLLTRIKRQMTIPGRKAYFDRLVEAWYDIWKQYRGTPELPDEEPYSIVDFDIRAHLDFFRSHIHKPSIRLAAAANPIRKKMDKIVDLPPTVDDVLTTYRLIPREISQPSTEAFWNPLGGDDFRLTTSMRSYHGGRRTKVICGRADSAPSASQPSARALLEDFTSEEVIDVSEELCNERVFRKTSNLTENQRQFAFTKDWLAIRDGIIPAQFYDETAKTVETLQTVGAAVDFSLLASGGEVAPLLDAVSQDQVDFDFDISTFPTIWEENETYNTRRFNDIDFEFDLKFSARVPVSKPHQPQSPGWSEVRPPTAWSVDPASIALPDEVQFAVLEAVNEAGAEGVSIPELRARLSYDRDTLKKALALMALDEPPTIFWAGYDCPRLVTWAYRDEWKVKCDRAIQKEDGRIEVVEAGGAETLPRVWIDIYGQKMEKDWQAICAMMTSLIQTRSGISEAALREKTSIVLDRLEVNDVLQYLLARGTCRRGVITGHTGLLPPVEATDDVEAVQQDNAYNGYSIIILHVSSHVRETYVVGSSIASPVSSIKAGSSSSLSTISALTRISGAATFASVDGIYILRLVSPSCPSVDRQLARL
ncbi:hypothetical protein BD324DRAFT_610180 [Kockovaella imperatae]|uniref:Uncharacterized protein n=1 Tax=Kockovaella imperatae TaxID=4999 RepID=A0A1Y1U817_9TREE|nr:hypothetical protein BD324DRAFT_610180 [Kockovaella imperatae]ORX34152.1 hypothetical protein BD324DRAFT_610180 [Kockovaella imperatae]